MTDIHTRMPNRFAELNCGIVKLNSFCQIDLTNRIAVQNKLPNRIAELNCRTELPNRIAKPNCRTELPN
jgi:hypothetical protein